MIKTENCTLPYLEEIIGKTCLEWIAMEISMLEIMLSITQTISLPTLQKILGTMMIGTLS